MTRCSCGQILSDCEQRMLPLVQEREQLRDLIREMLVLLPVEKPEQGPLPGWIVDLAERARKAVAA